MEHLTYFIHFFLQTADSNQFILVLPMFQTPIQTLVRKLLFLFDLSFNFFEVCDSLIDECLEEYHSVLFAQRLETILPIAVSVTHLQSDCSVWLDGIR